MKALHFNLQQKEVSNYYIEIQSIIFFFFFSLCAQNIGSIVLSIVRGDCGAIV